MSTRITKPSFFLFSILCILTMAACNKGPLNGYKKITKVFGYQILSDMDTGTKAGSGVYMIANAVVMTDKDSAVSDPNLGGGFYLQIPLRKPQPGSDLMIGFQKLSDGDSGVFIMLADTFFSKLNMNVPMPSNVKSGDYVKLYIEVLQLLDSTEYEHWLEQKDFENKAMAHQMFDEYIKATGITQEPDNNSIIRIVEKEGKGKSPIYGQTVVVNYICLSMAGQEIFNTYSEGVPHEFVLGDNAIIQGLNLSLIKMKKGEKSRLIIPYYLGYGEVGAPNVPPYTHLLMEVELMEIK